MSCPPGFEAELEKELREFWCEMMDLDGLPTRAAFPEPETVLGGLELETEEHLGYQIGFFSKLAGRVLLRLTGFESRYFDRFEKLFLEKAVPEIEKYLNPGPVALRIESHKSRLNNEKSLREALGSALARKNIKVNENARHTLLVRLEKDYATVSLDTSGEHLHRRGYAVHRGEAPLRETLAAFLVRRLAAQVNLDRRLLLVDPFAGSGTLLFEALSRRVPNLQRHYAWQDFRRRPKLFQSPTWMRNYRWLQTAGGPRALGIDVDPAAVANFEHNRAEFLKMSGGEDADLKIQCADSRTFQLPAREPGQKLWLICNPPYGIRLHDDRAREILENLGAQGPDGLVVIHPLNWNLRFQKLKRISQEDFSNQGLHLKLSVFVRPGRADRVLPEAETADDGTPS